MYRAKLSARVVAPLLVALLALIIGASIAQGASFPADISGVSVSTTMFPGEPAANLTVDPGMAQPAFPLQLDDDTGFPAAGQVVVFNLDLKIGTKDGLELLTYDNGTCVEGPDQLCITARAKKGTAKVAHPAGSTVKLATQLLTPIAAGTQPGVPGFTIDVTSTAGFAPTLTVPGNLLIDNELFQVHLIDADTWHVAKRAVETNTGNPTAKADHLANAIVTSPDLYVVTLTRQEHNTGDNTVLSKSKTYLFWQPLFPSIPQPFTPWNLGNAPIKLTFTPGGAITLAGTYNPVNGLLTNTFSTCAFAGTETDPPTTLAGVSTLTVAKNPLDNEFGVFGAIRDTNHSWYSPLSTMVSATGVPAFIEVVDATGAAASGQVLIGAELFTYGSKDTSTTPDRLNITSRANVGGGPAAQHNAGPPNSPVIQTPVCNEPAAGAPIDAHILEQAANAAFDSDQDGCSNWNELNLTAGSQGIGGLRDPWNPYDYMNPTKDGVNRVDDILAVVGQYHIDDEGAPDLKSQTDRTALTGGEAWNLGPPNGQQRVDDILASVKQYHHDC